MLVAGLAFCAAVLACMAGLTADQVDNEHGQNGIMCDGVSLPDGILFDLHAVVFLVLRRVAELHPLCKGHGVSLTDSVSFMTSMISHQVYVTNFAHSIYSVFTSSAGFFKQYVGIGWRYVYYTFTLLSVMQKVDHRVVLTDSTSSESAGVSLWQQSFPSHTWRLKASLLSRSTSASMACLAINLDIHAGEKPTPEAEMGKGAAVWTKSQWMRR